MSFSAGQVHTLYYLAYQDYEAEKKREEEEKLKKEKEKRKNQKRAQDLEALRNKGVRLPSKMLQEIDKQQKSAHRDAQRDSRSSNSSPVIPQMGLQDLIDELEG